MEKDKVEGTDLDSRRKNGDKRFPSLDGLRAISILMVLVGHLSGTRGFAEIDLGIGDYAHLGVVVFFVISGFLITSLLIVEIDLSGSLSISMFYARRAIRIFPAVFAFLGVLVCLQRVGVIQLNDGDFCWASTFTVNFHYGSSWEIGHLWSLSVEEQFYLIWPLLFVAAGKKLAVWAAAMLAVLGPIARAGAWLFLRGSEYYDLPMFPMVADSIAMGCLLAILRGKLELNPRYLSFFHPAFSTLLVTAVLLINSYLGYSLVRIFGTTIINLFLAILIHRSIYCHGDLVGRLLNWKPLMVVGTLSYSLYIWQQLFINRQSAAWMNAFPQNLALTIAVSLASYFCLEKPFLRLRRRLRP